MTILLCLLKTGNFTLYSSLITKSQHPKHSHNDNLIHLGWHTLLLLLLLRNCCSQPSYKQNINSCPHWRTGGDHQDDLVLRGWRLSSRTWNPTTSPWMKQQTWLRIVHSANWCLHLVLRTPTGACRKIRKSSYKAVKNERCPTLAQERYAPDATGEGWPLHVISFKAQRIQTSREMTGATTWWMKIH